MSVYQSIVEKFQFFAPGLYKERSFKRLKNLNENEAKKNHIEPELIWVNNFINKNDVFMDIGANIGAYLYILEKILKPLNIYAFEPNKQLFKRLKRIFPKQKIFDIALSDENCIAEFKVPIMNGKTVHSRGTLQTEMKEIGEENSETQKVRVVKLDDWDEAKRLQKLDFIKIDVEGNEFQTLLGAENTIKKFKPTLMVEIEQRHHKQPVWNIIQEVESWGYVAHYVRRDNYELERLTKSLIENQKTENMKNYSLYINNIVFSPK